MSAECHCDDNEVGVAVVVRENDDAGIGNKDSKGHDDDNCKDQ